MAQEPSLQSCQPTWLLSGGKAWVIREEDFISSPSPCLGHGSLRVGQLVTSICHSVPLIPKPVLSSSLSINLSPVEENLLDQVILQITLFMPAPMPFIPFCTVWPSISSMPNGKRGAVAWGQRYYRNAKMTSWYYMRVSFLSVIGKVPTLGHWCLARQERLYRWACDTWDQTTGPKNFRSCVRRQKIPSETVEREEESSDIKTHT